MPPKPPSGLLASLPRGLRERLETAGRDLGMLHRTLVRGERPSPLLERKRGTDAQERARDSSRGVRPRPVRVTRVMRETDDAVSLYLAELDGRPITFDAGQFLTFDLVVDGQPLRRAYSLASAAIEGTPPHVTVKRMHEGRASTFMNRSVREGDVLQVLGPSGAFVVEK
jgi:ring-1,2-phenylacetyl-CoA epoxidase subunit PaaE